MSSPQKITRLAKVILISFAVIHFSPVVEGDPLFAIEKDRLQLLKDALSWMTFRQNGVLMKNEDVEKLFLAAVTDRYANSKFYRTFVIAFHQGVLPKLTLKENENCDPGYTLKYKNPWNDSVTWYYQKKFTFESYKMRSDKSIKYCDYRLGLVCNAATKKCQCPTGTSMSPLETGSSLKRCLLVKHATCALMDLDHGHDRTHSVLRGILPEMIFNLEKPESCQPGTQCRFLKIGQRTAHCYDVSTPKDDWFPPPGSNQKQGLIIGLECSIGLYSHAGMCLTVSPKDTQLAAGNAPGYICYNFGPPRSKRGPGVKNRIGFCAHEAGSYSIHAETAHQDVEVQLWRYNFVMGFVHRRSVPLDEAEIRGYYRVYLEKVYQKLFSQSSNHQSTKVGAPCNMKKTMEMEGLWKYFASLEEDPPPNMDFVVAADNTLLNSKLEELIALVNGLASSEKICKVYWSTQYASSSARPPTPTYLPALTCEDPGVTPPPTGPNDGTCKESSDRSSKAFAEKVQMYSDASWDANLDFRTEEFNVDMTILDQNPEPECTPDAGVSRAVQLRVDAASIINGQCPKNYICFRDWSDSPGKYDISCKLLIPIKNLHFACHEAKDGAHYKRCEGDQLDKQITKAVEMTTARSTLERGSTCRKDVEKMIQDWVVNGPSSKTNKYKLLVALSKEEATKGMYCDRTKLLECGTTGFCLCAKNTEPRKAAVGSSSLQEYKSDYCYLSSGDCKVDITQLFPVTTGEKKTVTVHYGDPGSGCKGNLCVFLDTKNQKCTATNTGKTGIDVDSDEGDGLDKGTGNARGENLKAGMTLVITLAFYNVLRCGYAN